MAALAAEDEPASPRLPAAEQGPEQPLNLQVSAMLTDMYQISMAYGYWKAGRHDEHAVFELFFRKNPFKGEFTVFCGLDQVLRHLQNFKFTAEDIEYLRNGLPSLAHVDPGFFEYLAALDCSQIRVSAVKDGEIVFPRVTLVRVEGPLAVGQLLETTLLNLVNFPSLVCTNACRMRLAAYHGRQDPSRHVALLEFGLRRAQGPDGGVTASRYAYAGGFDGTSNVLAGKLTGIDVKGTTAHAFIQSYTGFDMIKNPMLKHKDKDEEENFVNEILRLREEKPVWRETNTSELAAFAAYSQCFPNALVALVDTYDTLNSGLENFIIVALALKKFGYTARAIRLDSGDLAYLSKLCRQKLDAAAEEHASDDLKKVQIIASNDIDESVLLALNNQGHAIDSFGIGTHLVTCKAQPALGCVYKLAEINGSPRIKLSQEIAKVMIPGRKNIYRLMDKNGRPLIDYMTRDTETPPQPGQRVMCRHPFQENKRCIVVPTNVVPLLHTVWDGPSNYVAQEMTLDEMRSNTLTNIANIREDIKRPMNPTPYKVSVSQELYNYLHELWLQSMPVPELS